MPTLKAGDAFPADVAFSYIPVAPESDIKSCGIPQKYDASKEFADKKIVIVALPGAFTPVCQASHLPGYIKNKAALQAKGVDHVVILAYNDAYVMSAWGKAHGVTDDFIIFASDANAKFSQEYGWVLGERTARYAIVVDHGKVIYASEDTNVDKTDQSGAEAVLAVL